MSGEHAHVAHNHVFRFVTRFSSVTCVLVVMCSKSHQFSLCFHVEKRLFFPLFCVMFLLSYGSIYISAGASNLYEK